MPCRSFSSKSQHPASLAGGVLLAAIYRGALQVRPGDNQEMAWHIVLRSNFNGRIASVWRSGRGWHPDEPTKFTTRAEAEKELDTLRQSQPHNVHRMFIETDRA